MNRFVLSSTLVLTLAFAAGPALAEATLRPNVVVDGDLVKLGDLFDNVDKPDTPVARAPAPGKRVTVDADWLQRVARNNGVDWKPTSAFDQALVERPGQTITHDQIEQSLLSALASEDVPPNSEIELANRATQISVPANVSTTIGVHDLTYDSHTRHFNATIEIPADSPSAQRIQVSGRVFPTIDVPVPARSISRGEVIGPRDFTWTKAREDGLRRDIVVDPDQLVGLCPRQTLRAGQMVSSADLEKPLAVAKGALVTMILKAGDMTLTTQGRAIEQGSIGQVIRVTNTHSNLTVEAKIDGMNRVSVAPTGTVALSD